MARPPKRKTQRADDTLQGQASSKKARLSSVSPTPSRPRKQKRPAEDLSQDQFPFKKPKSRSTVHRPSNFPPEFYDNLSKIWLTPRALQELNRRNENIPPPKPTAELVGSRGAKLAALAKLGVPELALFATDGGPDTFEIKGCPEPTHIAHAMTSASSSATSKRVSAGSRETQSTHATSVSARTKRSSAYDANFDQHCIDHCIYPPLYKFPNGQLPPKPANFEEIRQALKAPRGSLSPSVVPAAAFEDFQVKNTTKSEGTIMRSVVPLLAGDLDVPNEGHLPFANLESITENTTVNPVPDFFDGAQPGAVEKQIREDLSKVIIPTKHASVPVAPNFFLEAKGPGGTGDVARGQAVLDGAYGARIMHALQNYLIQDPVYDGNAYTFTTTLLDGTLKIYAHHLAAPTSPERRPDHHTTQVKAYALTGDDDVWLEGTGAFRNLRMLAKGYRDHFIETANARARKRNADAKAAESAAGEGDDVTSISGKEQGEGSSPLDFYDCQMFAEPGDDEQETQETQGTNVGLAIFHHPCSKGDEEDTEVSTGFATSFTSSFTSASHERPLRSQAQPKLPRSPPSPSSPRQLKKRGLAQ